VLSQAAACDDFPMTGLGTLVVRESVGETAAAMSGLVMAWARDIDTGEARYILELGTDRRGAKCGCECASCGLPLTAVNAGKAEFIRRPHFRHPEGAEKAACLILAARAAVLRTFQQDGWIELPRRRMSHKVAGLSGASYEAWVERPAERHRVSYFDLHDRMVAMLTLDDGRKVRVLLTGTAEDADELLDADGLPVPTILLDINEVGVAAMDPADIRRRLSLLPESLCWVRHWQDAELSVQAEAAARADAELHLDEVPADLEIPDDIDPALKRETVLHLAVKRILAEAGDIWAPGLEAQAIGHTWDGRTLRAHWSVGPHSIELTNVELERRFGRVVPDLTCRALPDYAGADYLNPLLIEVTVTNQLDSARLERIQETGAAALEIDLSRAGGRMTMEGLTELVVTDLSLKRWLFHPERDARLRALEGELAEQVAEALKSKEDGAVRTRRREEFRDRTLGEPLSDVAAEFLTAAIEWYDERRERPAEVENWARRPRLVKAAQKMRLHGFPEAAEQAFLGQGGILSVLLSIRFGRAVGARFATLGEVLRDTFPSAGPGSASLTLFLIALRCYSPELTGTERHLVETWASTIREDIRAGGEFYLRYPVYDRLVALLLPEMAAGLAKPGGRRMTESEARTLKEEGGQYQYQPGDERFRSL
jgi:hypothetical protein